jgi:hypothetical protein
MSVLIRKFAASLVISALLTQACYAQEVFPMSDRQKADIAKHKLDEKSTDEAYKATIKRTPDAKKADPWANLRAPPANNANK